MLGLEPLNPLPPRSPGGGLRDGVGNRAERPSTLPESKPAIRTNCRKTSGFREFDSDGLPEKAARGQPERVTDRPETLPRPAAPRPRTAAVAHCLQTLPGLRGALRFVSTLIWMTSERTKCFTILQG